MILKLLNQIANKEIIFCGIFGISDIIDYYRGITEKVYFYDSGEINYFDNLNNPFIDFIYCGF